MTAMRVKVGGVWTDVPTAGPQGPEGPAGAPGLPGPKGESGINLTLIPGTWIRPLGNYGPLNISYAEGRLLLAPLPWVAGGVISKVALTAWLTGIGPGMIPDPADTLTVEVGLYANGDVPGALLAKAGPVPGAQTGAVGGAVGGLATIVDLSSTVTVDDTGLWVGVVVLLNQVGVNPIAGNLHGISAPSDPNRPALVDTGSGMTGVNFQTVTGGLAQSGLTSIPDVVVPDGTVTSVPLLSVLVA